MLPVAVKILPENADPLFQLFDLPAGGSRVKNDGKMEYRRKKTNAPAPDSFKNPDRLYP